VVGRGGVRLEGCFVACSGNGMKKLSDALPRLFATDGTTKLGVKLLLLWQICPGVKLWLCWFKDVEKHDGTLSICWLGTVGTKL